MKRQYNSARNGFALACISLGLLGCASNDQLFAEYDAMCQLPVTTVALVESHATGFGAEWEPAVYFRLDKATLDDRERGRIEKNAALLKQNNDFVLSIRGFTDSQASSAYNLRLSERRVNEVVRIFREAGVADDRLFPTFGGEVLPVLPNADRKGRAANRRVEMLLMTRDGYLMPVGANKQTFDHLLPDNVTPEPQPVTPRPQGAQ